MCALKQEGDMVRTQRDGTCSFQRNFLSNLFDKEFFSLGGAKPDNRTWYPLTTELRRSTDHGRVCSTPNRCGHRSRRRRASGGGGFSADKTPATGIAAYRPRSGRLSSQRRLPGCVSAETAGTTTPEKSQLGSQSGPRLRTGPVGLRIGTSIAGCFPDAPMRN